MSAESIKLGIVAIGRNEGERLRRCLTSTRLAGWPMVYVDSGSTDRSLALAKEFGCEVVALDMTKPFTAARARNEGFQRLLQRHPGLSYVQFVDGDCEVVSGWLETASAFLEANPRVAVVFGRRRERHPDRSIYNMLCDVDWDKPLGEVKACGGDAMIRVDALTAAGGYRPDLIAGEEPELCIRLRAVGRRIWCLKSEMTLHDAAMTRFGQWWKRAVRSGHASAQGAYLHGAPPECHKVRESRSNWLWGLVLPTIALVGLVLFGPAALGLFAVYPLQVFRLALKGKRSTRENWWYALFVVLGKFPETEGQVRFFMTRILNKQSGLIEYK